MNSSREKGFTLVELLIVVAIVAVLAMIAYPSYQDYIREGRRSDAFDALLLVQNLQEKWRANNSTYGSLANIGYGGTASQEGFYTIAVSGTSATGYTTTASAVSGTTQAGDTGCTTLTITVSAANPRGAKTPAACW